MKNKEFNHTTLNGSAKITVKPGQIIYLTVKKDGFSGNGPLNGQIKFTTQLIAFQER